LFFYISPFFITPFFFHFLVLFIYSHFDLPFFLFFHVLIIQYIDISAYVRTEVVRSKGL
jgi:hypothetical protein